MKNSRTVLTSCLAGICLSLMLSGCGLKGPLYLPKQDETALENEAVVSKASSVEEQSNSPSGDVASDNSAKSGEQAQEHSKSE